MGGDAAPHAVIRSFSFCAEELRDVSLQLYGSHASLEPLVSEIRNKAACKDLSLEIVPTNDIVTANMKPAVAVRSHRTSSMGLAVQAVRQKRADAVLSAGNTGAFMALAKVILGTLTGIDRPAIATFLPTSRGRSLVLDLGANAECSSRNLVEFSFMGEALARVCLDIPAPSVGILNIGSEDTKGNRVVQEAAETLKRTGLLGHYAGFVEGTDIAAGTVDVIVTDGFTGNVALKTAEGTAQFIKDQLKTAVSHSLKARIGALMLRHKLQDAFARFDPRIYNGAIFLGFGALVVKSHGGADAFAFAHALKFAVRVARQNLLAHVKTYIDKWSSAEKMVSKI
jgi:glycerol-3-phosphate acyltransferase PlsX